MSIRIVEADLTLSKHRKAVLAMVDAYSTDARGSAQPLDPNVRVRLIAGLQKSYGSNDRALHAYEAADFSRYSFQEDAGRSIF